MKEYPEDKTDAELFTLAQQIVGSTTSRTIGLTANKLYKELGERSLWIDVCIKFHELKEEEKSNRDKRRSVRMLEAIKKIDPEEISKWLAERESSRSSGIERVRKHLDLVADTPDKLERWFARFFKWEKDLEERAYANGSITVSNFFSALDDLVREEGEEVTDNYHEDFLSTAYLWRGYTFKLYCGQGCFTRIMYKDEQIFQTT